MTTSVVIVGAGGFGREVRAWCADAGVEVAGFLDDNSCPQIRDETPLLGTIDEGSVPAEAKALIAIGDPAVRFTIARRLEARGIELTSMVHPTAYVASSATISAGAILCPFASVSTHARVGRNVAINMYASVAHDAVVGDHSVFSPYSTVNGTTELGEGVFLGTGAIATPGVKVGAWSKIQAGAVASRRIPAGTLAVGSPAKGRVMYSRPA